MVGKYEAERTGRSKNGGVKILYCYELCIKNNFLFIQFDKIHHKTQIMLAICRKMYR